MLQMVLRAQGGRRVSLEVSSDEDGVLSAIDRLRSLLTSKYEHSSLLSSSLNRRLLESQLSTLHFESVQFLVDNVNLNYLVFNFLSRKTIYVTTCFLLPAKIPANPS